MMITQSSGRTEAAGAELCCVSVLMITQSSGRTEAAEAAAWKYQEPFTAQYNSCTPRACHPALTLSHLLRLGPPLCLSVVSVSLNHTHSFCLLSQSYTFSISLNHGYSLSQSYIFSFSLSLSLFLSQTSSVCTCLSVSRLEITVQVCWALNINNKCLSVSRLLHLCSFFLTVCFSLLCKEYGGERAKNNRIQCVVYLNFKILTHSTTNVPRRPRQTGEDGPSSGGPQQRRKICH